MVAVGVDPDLEPTVVGPLHHVHGQVVEQLVGDHHPRDRDRGQGVERGDDRSLTGLRLGGLPLHQQEGAEGLVGRFERQPLPLLVPQLCGTLHEDVAQRGGALGSGPHDVGAEAAAARTGLDHHERVGLAQSVPRVVERTRDDHAEQRPDLRARDEVAPGPARAATPSEEAVFGVVERGLLELGKGDGPFPMDALAEPGVESHCISLSGRSCGAAAPTTGQTD